MGPEAIQLSLPANANNFLPLANMLSSMAEDYGGETEAPELSQP
mgnify:CR=1